MSGSDSLFNHTDLKIIKRRPLLQSWLRVEQVSLKHRLFQGGWSREIQRELLVKQAAAGILLYDPERDEVLLVRQFRIGLLDDQQSPWLLELVAGLVESGEKPDQVASREAGEEAACEPEDLIHICDYFNSPRRQHRKDSSVLWASGHQRSRRCVRPRRRGRGHSGSSDEVWPGYIFHGKWANQQRHVTDCIAMVTAE